MLHMTDLKHCEKLDHNDMRERRGGSDGLARLSALLDASTSIYNRVADVQQVFGFSLAQSNTGTLTNNQAIYGGNGVVYAPVYQNQTQANSMALEGIGNTDVA
ncbi:hypothetical protein [Parahaliea mediterranea]|uniref:Uncharacterized protein n=1 Tax=Parahaliea mediterranea TaxID=651086 RepID=A0A939DBH3_9GAMM|nr:hypothetical protein [Parahaliea mediterranea]MBN7795004.1 hypothetical protein [Parahaliea mediterranea]